MNKEYKVTYKTYYREGLKKVWFHNKQVHPLYIQIIFDRSSTTLKSCYFDLFAKPRHGIRISGKVYSPDLSRIEEKENVLVEFVINKNLNDFSLKSFKKGYAFYGRDLLDMMEEDFINYLYTFLHDEGLPFLAETIRLGTVVSKAYDIVKDLKIALKDTIYKKLLENSFYYAPPYLPLYDFSLETNDPSLASLSVMDWERPGGKEGFISFFTNHYPGKKIDMALEYIQKLVEN